MVAVAVERSDKEKVWFIVMLCSSAVALRNKVPSKMGGRAEG